MRLAPEKIAALALLGFSTDDSAGNFLLDIPTPKPPDFGTIADLMLKALYDGYDARVDTVLEFNAPFAPGLTLACDPGGVRNGFSFSRLREKAALSSERVG